MDFNLKQWREESEKDQDQEKPPSSALPLFVPELTTTNHLSPFSSYHHSSATSSATTKPRMGSQFSLGQWQELELQALIFRHMIAGYGVPPDLLHLVKKSLITSALPLSASSSHYLSYPLHHYYPNYQSDGYWGKAAMDPEPGRCRRTDGKKWRCSRDVVAGQKYCERHVHRGRNRSRKPVEIPTSTNPYGGGNGGEALKASHSVSNQGTAAATAAGSGPGQFTLSGPSPSMDLLHLNRRPLESIIETEGPFKAQNGVQPGGDLTLRHFFDDWPRSLHEADSSVASATNLSISMPGNNPSSDFSLKLGTGNTDGDGSTGGAASSARDGPQSNWAFAWDTNRAGPMGGPLAEALRSSISNSLPTTCYI